MSSVDIEASWSSSKLLSSTIAEAIEIHRFASDVERQGFSKLSSLHSSQVVPFLESNLPYKTDLFLLEAETLRFI